MGFPENPPTPKNHLLVLGNRLAFRWEEERPGHRLPPVTGSPWWMTLPGWSDGHGPFMKCGNSLHPPWFRWCLIFSRGGTPKSSSFHRIFHYKPSILGYFGYPDLWKSLFLSGCWIEHDRSLSEKIHGIHLTVRVPEKMGGNPWSWGYPNSWMVDKKGKSHLEMVRKISMVSWYGNSHRVRKITIFHL